jgi:hypothetical protein
MRAFGHFVADLSGPSWDRSIRPNALAQDVVLLEQDRLIVGLDTLSQVRGKKFESLADNLLLIEQNRSRRDVR